MGSPASRTQGGWPRERDSDPGNGPVGPVRVRHLYAETSEEIIMRKLMSDELLKVYGGGKNGCDNKGDDRDHKGDGKGDDDDDRDHTGEGKDDG